MHDLDWCYYVYIYVMFYIARTVLCKLHVMKNHMKPLFGTDVISYIQE